MPVTNPLDDALVEVAKEYFDRHPEVFGFKAQRAVLALIENRDEATGDVEVSPNDIVRAKKNLGRALEAVVDTARTRGLEDDVDVVTRVVFGFCPFWPICKGPHKVGSA